VNQRNILLVGDIHDRDFSAPIAWMQSHTSVHIAQSQAEALHWLRQEDGGECAAIVLAQARDGGTRYFDMEALHAAAPLARLILLLGTWCEGDSRSSRSPAGVLRVYWHQFIARAEREWLGNHEDAGMWTLARTFIDNDQLLHTWRHPLPQRTGLIAIHADSLITYECLAEMCGLGGWSTTWLAPRQPLHLQRTSILLWDISAAVVSDFHEWQTCHEQLHPRASIVLVGFPRQQDIQLLHEAGAAHVFAKPLVVADLLNALDRAAGEDTSVENQRRAG